MVQTRSRPGMTYLHSERGYAIYRKHHDSEVRFWNGVEQKEGWDMVPEFTNVMACEKCEEDLYEYAKEIGMLRVKMDFRACTCCDYVARCGKCARREFKCRGCRRS